MARRMLKSASEERHNSVAFTHVPTPFKPGEPAGLEISPERASVLDSIICTHLDALGYSVSELSGLIPLHEDEFVSMYGAAANLDNRPKLRIVR